MAGPVGPRNAAETIVQGDGAIRTIGVIGGGQMGRGIAQVAAQAGLDVLLVDASQAQAEAAVATLAKGLGKLVEKGKLDAKARDQLVARIAPRGAVADVGSCDLVIEAVPEDAALKLGLFATLGEVAREDAILASNTSSLSITKLAAAARRRPERVIGMHFMNPVPLMKLVEVVRGLQTDEPTYLAVLEVAARLGKTTVTARDVPGFIVNRILIPLINEAAFALFEGLGTPEDIDTGIKLGLNHPMGPLELADLIGLDTCVAIADVLHRELGDPKYRACTLMRQHVAAGWLGKKTGRGFHTYDATGARRPSGGRR